MKDVKILDRNARPDERVQAFEFIQGVAAKVNDNNFAGVATKNDTDGIFLAVYVPKGVFEGDLNAKLQQILDCAPSCVLPSNPSDKAVNAADEKALQDEADQVAVDPAKVAGEQPENSTDPANS